MRKMHNIKKEFLVSTKFGKFLCIFESNDPDPGFTVSSPATPGFVTYGRTLEEAKRMAREGIEFHCECQLFERISVPRRILQRATK